MSDILTPVTFSISAFSQFLPPFHAIYAGDPNDPELRQRMRQGEIVALAVVVAIGALASNLAKSPEPIYAVAVTGVLLVVLYESAALRKVDK